jgi:predicted flap endonuclease-1-like 5' DNA nuclease
MPAHPDTYARFYTHPQRQSDGSHKDVVMVEIHIKGNKNTSFSEPATDELKKNYPKAWAAYEQNNPDLCDGNPIGVLPGVGPSQAIALQGLGIFSIEDLAALGEPGINNVPGGRTLQKRAKAYLDALHVKAEDEPSPETVDVKALSNNPNVERTERKKPGPKPKIRAEEEEAA